ncbi:hypothetical protein SLS59_009083 [Nothophoma quercina]|uniref:Uncharacterized protein n=1 Tax=Nothophoma quercina TaxID=749835 RepID=A0ABR3QPH2_9PLEO
MKEEMVISRVARQHYGMCLEVPYDYSAEQRLLGLDRLIFEPAEGNRAFVTGRMEWMGARIRQLRPSSYTGIRYLQFPEELAGGKIDFDIWVCADLEAPAWITRRNETFRMVKVSMTMVPNGNTIDFVVRFEGQRLDKAASSDCDHEQPVLDGELLQDEVTRLQQELSVTRDRLNQTKTELAFQQSRRPNDYDDAYFEVQLDGLRSQIRDWCISYFANSRGFITPRAEKKFKPLSNEWIVWMTNKGRRPWIIQARVWYALDQLLFDSTSTKRASWLFTGQKAGHSVDKMFAQVMEAKSILREITAAALTFHLDMMKYTTELSFADDKGGKDRPEESLGSDLRGRVRLEVSPPLSKMTAFGDTTPNRQVLRPAQVCVTGLEQQSQTRVEKAIAPLYITESDVPKSNSNRRRSSDTRGNETRRRNG